MIQLRLKNTVMVFFMLCLCFSAWAQRSITGTVTDAENGETLIGATIRVVGASAGTTTGADGTYRIVLPAGSTQLQISYTGYISQTLNVGTSGVVDVALLGTVLEDVVVIGYGTIKREDATGLVQSVSSGSFNRGAIASPQQLLAGKIAGVTIITDGSPGGGSKIRIRGESSLSASNDPLIVVDGVPLDNGGTSGNGVSGNRNQLNFINPADIESFTVLKDASAAAIYGNRASGGVIIITTKKGKLGKKVSISYTAEGSAGKTANRVDMLTPSEFRAAIAEHYPQTDPTAPPHPYTELLGTANTNWQDVIYQTAQGQNHNLNFSGGIGIVPYRVSVGYTNMDGTLKTDNFKRYTTGVNLSPGFLNNTLQVNLNFKGMLSDNHFADRGAIGNALRMDPTQAVFCDTCTRYGGYTTWTIANGNPNGLAPVNPLSLLELRDDNSTVKQYIANGSVDYRFPFLPALRANLMLGYDYSNGSGSVVVPNYAAFAFDALNGGGTNNQYEQTKKNSILESYLNYKKSFGEHDLDLMAGYSWQHFETGNYYKNSDSAGTPAETTEGADPAEFFLISNYARVNYSFRDIYFLTGSLRRDGTSRFAPEYRWGLFPAAALAVKVFDNGHKYFGNLKVRTSWGVTGQQDIGDYYAYLARYQIGTPSAQYQFGDEFITTIRPNGYVGDIRWEETTSRNLGADFSIIKNRLSGSADYYKRNTKDLLNYIPFSALSNLTNFGTDNIGTMESKGFELSLNLTPVLRQRVSWDISTNFAWNRSTITKLTTSDDPTYKGVFTGDIAGGVGSKIQIHSVGYAPSSFYLFGQFYDEDGTLLEGQYADWNLNGVVNDDDKYRFKQPAPVYTIGLTSNLTLGAVDFSFAGRSHIGNYVYNNVKTDMGFLDRLYHSANYLSNVHQSAVDLNVNDQAKLTFSDHFVTNASFFRLDHVTLGYTVKFWKKRDANVRFYATAQNPLVVTNYDGLDPEIGNGIDNNIYPRAKTYLFGFGVNF